MRRRAPGGYLERVVEVLREGATVSVPPETLSLVGTTHVFADVDIDPAEFAELFEEVRTSRYAHTWAMNPIDAGDAALETIYAFENRIRPSVLIGYYARGENDTRHLYGVAVLSDRIRHDFPHEGFPVISRCYIRREFRARRLYLPTVEHRVRLCELAWGENLRGIHLASNNPRVLQAIRHSVFSERSFTYIGNERLSGTYASHVVCDFLHITPRFAHALMGCFEGAPDHPDVARVHRCVEDLLANRLDDTGYYQLRHALGQAEQNANWQPAGDALQLFVDFCEAVPLLQRAEPEAAHAAPLSRASDPGADG